VSPFPIWGRGNKKKEGLAIAPLLNSPLRVFRMLITLKASPLLDSPIVVTTQTLDRIARHILRCKRPLPGNYPHTVLGCSRGVKSLLAGDSKGVSPLVFIVRKEKRSKNQANVIKRS